MNTDSTSGGPASKPFCGVDVGAHIQPRSGDVEELATRFVALKLILEAITLSIKHSQASIVDVTNADRAGGLALVRGPARWLSSMVPGTSSGVPRVPRNFSV